MFTGLIRHLGTLASRTPRPGGARLRIDAPGNLLEYAEPGASICVNGACLTVAGRLDGAWEADLSEETLTRTTLGSLSLRATLHLEPSLRVGDPLDGHLVSGHVDAIGQLVTRTESEGLWRFSLPASMAALVAPKSSVTVDGISLTVVGVGSDWFSVALIPETVRRTRLEAMRPGAEVNLEGDPVGRFVARNLELRGAQERLGAFAERGWSR
jgi:riboflavin synthase